MPRRVAVGLLASSLAFFGLALAAPAGATEHETSTERLAGANRFGTAADVCAQMNEEDDINTVVIATARNFPDALAAAPLAAAVDGCILLTEIDSLPDATLAAIRSIDPERAIIVGGTSAVSNDVEAALEDEVATVDRVAGDDRYCTAAEVAAEIGDGVGTAEGSGNTAILATGTLAPDALAAGSISTGGSDDGVFPILLARGDSLPACTSNALGDFENVIVVGGTAAVGNGALAEAEDASGDDDATRVAGNNREETSTAIGRFAVEEFGWVIDEIILATGRPPAEIGTFSPDALVAGPLAGERQAPIILVAGVDTLGPAAEDFIEEFGGGLVLIICVGGTAVISNDTCNAASTLAEEQDPVDGQGPGNETVTVRPELVSAQILGTTTAEQATPTNPAGTAVRFVFDEALGQFPVSFGNFRVYNAANQQFTGATGAISEDRMSVTVIFTGVTTAANAANLTLATVNFGAVRDVDGLENPEGDAPIGNASTTPAGQAGITAAPDLTNVSGFRQAATANNTAVDFTFDQAAQVATPTGFRLVMTDNTEIICNGPVAGSTTPGSGGTVAGGGGTTTITVTCANPINPATGTAQTTPITPGQVARGYVQAGAVTTSVGGANPNPLQAHDVSGNTTGPDLVTVTFQRGVAGTTVATDQAIFTFDQQIATATVGNFRVYDTTGTEIPANTAEINPNNTQQVRVVFGTIGALDNAVGGNVRDGAVITATGGTAAQQNQEDEEGAAATGVGTQRQPGLTSGPNLQSVALAQTTDAFGNPGAFRATYTFDEQIVSVNASLYFLYLADGTRYRAGTCTIGATTATQNSVSCTGYVNALTGVAPTAAQQSVIGTGTLGTVQFGAAVGTGGAGTDSSPEAGEPTTGGTGTPRNE